MYCGIVLNVGLLSNLDGIDIASEHAVVKDGGVIAEFDPADENRSRGGKYPFPQAGKVALIG